MPSQKGGGSIAQSLRYMDPAAPEQSGPAGSNLLKEHGLIARPAIGGGTRKKRGGFYPSVMSGVVNAGVVLAPLTAMAARKLWSRKGGTRKGNRWVAEKEEAKRILEAIHKPSAKNVLAFAAAKRRGSGPTEEFLEGFREKAMVKAIANEDKRIAKEEKKAARAAKKGTKKVKKAAEAAAGKPPSAASTASRSGSMSSNNSGPYRAPTQAQLLREAKENAARAAAELKAAKAKRPVKNSQLAWFTLIDNAQKRLAANGTPSRKNAMRYASLLKQGKADEAEAFLMNFRARSRKSNKRSANRNRNGNGNGVAASAAPKKSHKVKASEKAAAGNNSGAKKPKEHSAASKRYFEELKTARQLLGEVGHPTGPNMSKFASMRLKGENTTAWLENFKSRRPKSLATAKAEKKGKAAAAAAPAALSAVAEANENANSMQGYSDNFESEE